MCQAIGACFAHELCARRCVTSIAICDQPSGPSPTASAGGAQLLTQAPRRDLVGVQKSASTERCTEVSEILYFIFSVSHLCWRQFMILLRPPLKVFSVITGPKCGLYRVAKTSLRVWLPIGLGFRRSGKKWLPALGFPANLCPLCAHSTSMKQLPSPRVRVCVVV